jgi:glutathionyl-hydroquinone reductase
VFPSGNTRFIGFQNELDEFVFILKKAIMESTRSTGNTWLREIGDDGSFVRAPTNFHGSISSEPTTKHTAEAGRYHLYVSLA